MSAYCSPDDIEPVIPRDRLASLVGIDNAGSGGSEYTGAVTRYIVLASNEIESNLGSLYVLPITGTQSLRILKNICALLAIGYIYQLSTATITEELQKLVDGARELLMTYGNGGSVQNHQWIAKSLPDASTHDAGPAVIAPTSTYPFPEEITLGRMPCMIEVNT